MHCFGKKDDYALEVTYDDDSQETEISMYVKGKNILAFRRNGQDLTTRWNLDHLALWLRHFLDHMQDDPYPVPAEGEYAAMKDINARNFDSDDDVEFDAYYDRLDAWNLRHRWHTEADGAILADVYFEQKGGQVEVSWNNEDAEEGVDFFCRLGGARVEKSVFCDVTNAFLREYANHWFH